MKYSFTAEVETTDKSLKMFFDADNARDLRGAWQGIQSVLFDLKHVGIVKEYAMEASENTADAWEERAQNRLLTEANYDMQKQLREIRK